MKITIQKSKIEMIKGPYQEGNDFKLRIIQNPIMIVVKGNKELIEELYNHIISDLYSWVTFEVDDNNKLIRND